MKSPYRKLESALGYRFRRKAHLTAALTHRSYRFEMDGVDRDNQRLEFLGDAVLGLIAADHLFNLYTDQQEGQLTHLRSKLANRRTLARIASRLELGDYLRFGKGEELSGGASRSSNLADCLEAIIGAAYVDGGPKAARRIFNKLFLSELTETPTELIHTNPKGALQELTQKQWKLSPRYRIVTESGPPHNKQYEAEVTIQGEMYGRGKGSNKQSAEIAAAAVALERLLQEHAETLES